MPVCPVFVRFSEQIMASVLGLYYIFRADNGSLSRASAPDLRKIL